MHAFEKMADAGLGRLLQHMVSGPFAILSADGIGMTPEERKPARVRLKKLLKDMNCGFVDTEGAWREEPREYAHEGSVFITGMSPEVVEILGRTLDQQVVIVGSRGRFSLMYLNEDRATRSGDFDLHAALWIPDVSAPREMYTQIGKHRFELRMPDAKQVPDPFSPQAIDEYMDGPDWQKLIEIGRIKSPEEEQMLKRQLERINDPPMPDPLLQIWSMSPEERRRSIETRRRERKAGRPGPLSQLERVVVTLASSDGSRDGRAEFRADPHEGAILHYPMVAFSYEGKPPIMLAKFGVRAAGRSFPEFAGSMAYRIPFVAKLVKVLPEFEPSPRWGEPLVPPPPLPFTPADPEVYEDTLAGLARFVGDVGELFRTQLPGINMNGFDSLYLGPSGRFFLLHPHTHDETARTVLRTVHPDLPVSKVKGRTAGGYKHTDLTRASGIQRIQIYRDGMGVTVEMCRPPNSGQLEAIREAYMLTPMVLFVAEINVAGTTFGRFALFGELVEFVGSWDPGEPDEMVRGWPWLAGVFGETDV